MKKGYSCELPLFTNPPGEAERQQPTAASILPLNKQQFKSVTKLASNLRISFSAGQGEATEEADRMGAQTS